MTHLATRCTLCGYNDAAFGSVIIYNKNLAMNSFYSSRDEGYVSYPSYMCPIITIPASVSVTVSPSTDTSLYHKNVHHVVV